MTGVPAELDAVRPGFGSPDRDEPGGHPLSQDQADRDAAAGDVFPDVADSDGGYADAGPAHPDDAYLDGSRRPEDWAWVEEWHAGGEPTPWAPGVAFGAFVGVVVASAVLVLSTGLDGLPLVDVLVNLAVAAGLAPAVWLSRRLPVLRWAAGGAVLGLVVGWIGALLTLR